MCVHLNRPFSDSHPLDLDVRMKKNQTFQIHSCTFGILNREPGQLQWNITHQQFIMVVPHWLFITQTHTCNTKQVTSCFNNYTYLFSKTLFVRITDICGCYKTAHALFTAARGDMRSFVPLNEVWTLWEEESISINITTWQLFLSTQFNACGFFMGTERIFEGEEINVFLFGIKYRKNSLS